MGSDSLVLVLFTTDYFNVENIHSGNRAVQIFTTKPDDNIVETVRRQVDPFRAALEHDRGCTTIRGPRGPVRDLNLAAGEILLILFAGGPLTIENVHGADHSALVVVQASAGTRDAVARACGAVPPSGGPAGAPT